MIPNSISNTKFQAETDEKAVESDDQEKTDENMENQFQPIVRTNPKKQKSQSIKKKSSSHYRFTGSQGKG